MEFDQQRKVREGGEGRGGSEEKKGGSKGEESK